MAGGIFGGGTGAANSPFLIEDIMDLNALRNRSTYQHFKLAKNINMNVWPYNVGAGWEPINGFRGVFDGGKFSIKNLYINRPLEDFVGLFGEFAVAGSRLLNVLLEGVNITGKNHVGALAGRVSLMSTAGVAIENIKTTGSVKGVSYVGGIFGLFASNNPLTMRVLLSSCSVRGAGDYVSGIIGHLYGTGSSGSAHATVSGLVYFGRITNEGVNPPSAVANYSQYLYLDNFYYLAGCGGEDLNGTALSYENLTVLGATSPAFSTTDVYFEAGIDPKLAWEIFPVAEPKAFIKNGGLIHVRENGAWVSIGASITPENVSRGNPWGDIAKLEWWKDFPLSSVEILLHSDKVNPRISVGIETYGETEDLINSIDMVGNIVESAQNEALMDPFQEAAIYLAIPWNQQTEDFDVLSFTAEELPTEEEMNKASVFIAEDTSRESDGFDVDVIGLQSEVLGQEASYMTSEIAESKEVSEAGLDWAVSSLALDDSHVAPDIQIIGAKEDYTKYAISKDGGATWWSYQRDAWIEVTESSIGYSGMRTDELNALGYMQYKEFIPSKAYLYDIKILAVSSGSSDTSEVTISSLSLEYLENQPPFFEEAGLDISAIHEEFVTITARFVDNENDEIFYRLMVKNPEDLEFRGADERGEIWRAKKSGDRIALVFRHTQFKTGENIIRLIAKDDRGAEYYEDFNLYLNNEKASIVAVSDRYKMSISINDEDGDKVAYRVWANGEMLFDFSEYFYTPATYTRRWNPGELLAGQINQITIEVKDSIGDISEYSFEIFGEYSGIMFKDEAGDHYTSEMGELLKYLDFGMVVGGTTSRAVPVDVSNETGLRLEDLRVSLENDVALDGTTVEISSEEMPFIPATDLLYEGPLSQGQSKRLYVRISSTKKDSRGLGDFSVSARADKEE